MDDGRRTRFARLARHVCRLVLFTISVNLHAQLQSGTGGLIGQVFCSDTQKPARFAMVSLVPDVTESDNTSYMGRRGFGSSTTASTTADGTFAMKDVPAGVYDVQVVMPGYVQPIRQLNLFPDSDTATRQVFIKMLTRVTVQAGQTTNATVTAYRGADLIGSVYYDDGTPAAGLTVSPLIAIAPPGSSSTNPSATTLRTIGGNAQTDDRGHFHLSGLADGTYTVQAVPRNGSIFPMFLGNTIDRTKATMITIKSGEERSGLDLIVNLTDLHRVRGVFTSPEGHALPNVNVALSLAEGPGAFVDATTGIDGSFTFSSVPDGKFTAAASGGTDPDTHVVYSGAKAQVTVNGSDINDVVLTATQ